MNLAIGKACSADGQCASGTCRTESVTGWPSGACVAGVGSCSRTDAGVTTGCPAGSVCAFDEFGTFCRQACTGSGSAPCRAGYACHDEDNDSSTPRWCVPLCTADADCARLGGNYGCNAWSKRCELKDKGLSKYGASCGSGSQCESGICLGGSGGYCSGLCLKSGGTCGGDGVCGNDGTSDATGRCFDGCAASNDCRSSPYSCRAPPYGGGSGNVCYCSREGEPCGSAADCCATVAFCFPGVNLCVF
jgi:hypothetical protein